MTFFQRQHQPNARSHFSSLTTTSLILLKLCNTTSESRPVLRKRKKVFHPGLFNLNQVFGPKSLNNYLNSCSSTSEKAEVETPGQVVWNMELPPKEMLVTLHPQSSPQQLQRLSQLFLHTDSCSSHSHLMAR